MFNFLELKQIQVEITNRCQASCPMCARNIHGGIDNPLIEISDWTLNDFKQILNREVLTTIECVNFCGDYGEPTINNNLLEMCAYAKEVNPNINIIISTNAGTRTPQWWSQLAKELPNNHTVFFALDGLEDTHHLYRIGTSYSKIIENAKAFIAEGGVAEWVFILFKHNEHQIGDARLLSESLGFKKFTLKHSKRFGKSFPVLDRDGNKIYHIEPPTGSKVKSVEFVDVKDYKQIKDAKVDCMAVNNKEVFIDANFKISPCCFTGYFPQANYNISLFQKYGLGEFAENFSVYNEIRQGFFDFVNQLGGWDALDVRKHSVKEILSREDWQTLLKKEWIKHSNLASACIVLCSDKSPFLRIEDQIV
jgi:MoaA/NifB/PqqE/SkfB family radical SAM enzyme